MNGIPDRRPLLFVHLPKTAGTSVIGPLGARFAPARVLSFNRQTVKGADAPPRDLDDHDFVHGHVPFDLRRRFRTPPFVMTVLRDPIERAVSAYHYLRSDALAALHPAALHAWSRAVALARRTTLAGFVREDPGLAAWHLGDLQVRLLSHEHGPGWSHADHAAWRPVTATDLARARENLVACDAFGLTERLPESIELLSHALRAGHLGYPGWANRTPGRPEAGTLDDETLALLRDLTEHDSVLYRFAVHLFEQRRRDMMRALLARPEAALADAPVAPVGASEFLFNGPIPGEGWYAPERAASKHFSWTGPDRESWLMVRSPAAGDGARLEVDILHALLPEGLARVRLLFNDWPIPHELSAAPAGHRLSAAVPAWLLRPAGEANRIRVIVERAARPCDVAPPNPDSRLLGLAVSRVALLAAP